MASYYGAACRKLGYESHYFSMADGKVAEDSLDVFHEINIFEKDKIVEICKEIGIDGVVATTELSVSITAYVANKLGLLGNPVEVAAHITDKYRNRECIKNLPHLLSPRYVKAKTIEEIRNSDVTYPMIIKPISLGGKRGISVVNSEDELPLAYEYAMGCLRQGAPHLVLAEEFLNGGMECSVESISYKGKHTIIQITQKDSSGAPHCVELGHHQPAPLSKENWSRVVEGVSEGLTAIGIVNGPCHTEIKVINDKVYLIEFNARPGGDHIWQPMVFLSTGYDIILGAVQAATGDLEPIDVDCFNHHYSGIYYVVEQTKYLKPIFDSCNNQSWCIEKNYVTDALCELKQNDMEHTNYMIYSSRFGDPIAKMLSSDDLIKH